MMGKETTALRVRQVRDSDIKWITRSIEKEKWGFLESDVKTCFDLEPTGCFVAEKNGRRVGHAFSVIYENFSWVSLVIVDSRFRRQGIAAALMEQVLSYLDRNGSGTVYLEAVPQIADLYRKFGFRDWFDSLRFIHPAMNGDRPDIKGIRPFQSKDLEAAVRFDARYFGCPRALVIRNFYNRYPDLCFLKKQDRDITGMIMARKTFSGYWIGPLTCAPEHWRDVKALLENFTGAVSGAPPEVKLGIPSINQKAVEVVAFMGFEKVGHSIRMVRGKDPLSGDLSGIFCIAGPEKG